MHNNCNQETKVNQEKSVINSLLYSDSLTVLIDRREAVDVYILMH